MASVRRESGVGGDQRAGLAQGRDLLVERLLHVQALDDRLGDPVGLGQELQMVLRVARGDELGLVGMHEGRRARGQQALDRALGNGIPVLGIL
jgi:hypothetical protein